MRAFGFIGCFFAFALASASAATPAHADAWARELTLSAGVGYATPTGTVAAELEWLPMPILGVSGAIGTDGTRTSGAASLRLQIPSASLAIGLALGGAIDAMTLEGPEATTELHLAWRDEDGLALRIYAGFAHPVQSSKAV